MRSHGPRGRILVGLLLASCTSDGPREEGAALTVPQAPPVIPVALAEASWPVRMADDAIRAPFEQVPGWSRLVMERNYPAALADFAAPVAVPEAQARVHVELAAAYRAAARLAAVSTVTVYESARREEDPPEVDCLVGVSHILLGAPDAGRPLLQRCQGLDGAGPAELGRAWLRWLDRGAAWPPTAPLAASPGGVPAGGVGQVPDAGDLPHFRLQDQVEGLEIRAADPARLLALSLVHEAAAGEAAPAAVSAMAAWLDPWRLPVEPPGTGAGAGTDALIFGSTLLVPGDVDFLAALGRGEPRVVVAEHQDRSALASAVAPCLAEAGIEVPCVLERAGGLFDQLLGAMESRSGGEAGFHRPFAELARAGVVRAGERVAERIGDAHAMGLLRLNALDFSIGAAAEPQYLLTVAAWDAGNRNAARAEELLHAQVGHLPGVEVARFPLDALHVRLSREAAPSVPMH